MNKFLVAVALLLYVTFAHADSRIDNMAANCNVVMEQGTCRVALDPKDYPNPTIPIILPSGVRRIDTQTYLSIRALGFQKDAQGHWLMCQKVFDVCNDWDSDGCLAVRSLWRQD